VEGKTVYDITIDQVTQYMVQIAEMGALILGGCCGTTPDYIRGLIDKTKNLPVPFIKAKPYTIVASATKAVVLGGDVNVIGEAINPTTNKQLKATLREGDMNIVTKLAMNQKKRGAAVLNVNMGLPELDEVEAMIKAVDTVSRLVDCPLAIDSTNPKVFNAVLRSYPGKCIINSVNGNQNSMDAIFPIAKKYGAVVLCLTMDEAGIPDTWEKRVEIAKRIIKNAEDYGIPKKNLIIDCLTLTASAQQEGVRETLKAVRAVIDEFGISTALGVSNISYGLPGRELLNRTFLGLALEAGLRSPIINTADKGMQDTIAAFRALWGLDSQCMEYANQYKEQKSAPVTTRTAREPGLREIIIDGLTDQVAETTARLLETTDPMDVVNMHIIPALDEVGAQFETGECFLPHLIFAAETAEKAFEVIKKTVKQRGSETVNKGKIILATVEGDVHDIGKNILKVILENYGYEIIDLGKDVKSQTIVDAVKKDDIRLVGLSALMTTTVKNMEKIIKDLRHECPQTKVMVGGAVLNTRYAETIGADYYGKDTREGSEIARKVFD
jgi:5-methyltetrahydrofolate--homocysteine methyltransferase